MSSGIWARWIVAATLGCTAAPAAAVTDAQLQHCRSIGDAAARLACYDALTPAVVSAPAAASSAAVDIAAPVPPTAAPAPPAAPAAPATVAADASTQANFGAEALRRKEITAASPEQLQARIVGTVDTLFRGSRLKLDNGQVWQYLDSRELLLDLRDPAVTIERNFIGSYWMRFDGRSTSIKVRRIQ